ncbi:MAG: lantibiotic dehydratase [Simkaniaceae bacterium]|nr:lantibiotic dehydratase [Candidatus Sacchlamyda saccharinae]
MFKAAPFFLFRSTMRSEQDLERILCDENWVDVLIEQFENDPILREAILIASPTLYNCLCTKLPENRKSVAESLLRYFIRMSTRATPFGLFSLVMHGEWETKTDCSFDLEEIEKRIRPDMEWLYLLIYRAYQDRDILFSLPVQTNPLLHLEGGRINLDYFYLFKKNEEQFSKKISVFATPLIRMILELAEEAIPINGLWESLQEKIPSLDRNRIQYLFSNLIEQQLLLPALIPSLLDPIPFEKLCAQLPFKSPEIQEIKDSFEKYGKATTETHESLSAKLSSTMNSFIPTKNVLQMDAVYSQKNQKISPLVAKELEETLDQLWKLSQVLNPPSPYEKYLDEFIRTYGSDRTVPLVELFKENAGLGAYHKYPSPSREETQLFIRWENWLFKHLQEALYFHKKEILITTQMIDDFLQSVEVSPRSPEEAIPSLEVFCKLSAASAEAIDRGEFTILYLESNWHAGGAAGRFLDLLGDKAKTSYQAYLLKEEEQEPNSIFAELSYMPCSVRLGNVATQPCLRAHRLDLQERKRTKGSIRLKDIYVGVADNRFYLTLKEGGKELIFRSGNFLNPDFAPPILRFCRDVSLFRSHRVSAFSWGRLRENASYLPRVRFQKTILASAQWSLDLTQLASPSNTEFQQWAQRWNLPEQFFLCTENQELLINRAHKPSVEMLLSKLKSTKSLRLVENAATSWLKSSCGVHSSELVIPFFKTVKSKPRIDPLSHTNVVFEDRWKLPGREWLYARMYLHEGNAKHFLINQLADLGESLCETQRVQSWHFLHYSFPERHIRFRFQFSSSDGASSEVFFLENIFNMWMKEGYIHTYEFVPYQREIERYGGIDSIEEVEKLFHADSRSVISLLESTFFQEANPGHLAIALISFLKDFGLENREVIMCLGSPKKSNFLEGFREYKNEILHAISALEEYSEEQSQENSMIELFFRASSLRLSQIQKFCACIDKHPKKIEIYNSLLHMHCNRLGLDKNEERKARTYASHALMIYLKKMEFSQRNALRRP